MSGSDGGSDLGAVQHRRRRGSHAHGRRAGHDQIITRLLVDQAGPRASRGIKSQQEVRVFQDQ